MQMTSTCVTRGCFKEIKGFLARVCARARTRACFLEVICVPLGLAAQ